MNNLSIINRPVAALQSYERNARTHGKRQIRQIADSIKAFGFTNPVLVDHKDMIIAGHGRVEAALLLGMAEVPTIRLEHLSEDQVRAYILADNKLAEKAGWDKGILAIELQHLMTIEADLDITLTGFEHNEVELIIGEQAEAGEESAPLVSSGPAVTQPGDLWLLGEHRLLCGDATDPASYDRLMDGRKAVMTFTDPPYNVAYSTAKHREIANDDLGGTFGPFLETVCRHILTHTDGATYICMSSSELHTLQVAFMKAGGHWSTFLIWAKNTFSIGRSDYQRQYEPILYGWREGAAHHWCGARDQGDVWHFDKPARNDIHPTMKPVALVMRAIRNSSEKGSLILDPFMGSGTTLIAAERTKRICYGMELDPLYVDATIRRWQRQTGLKAMHAETGQIFDVQAKEVA